MMAALPETAPYSFGVFVSVGRSKQDWHVLRPYREAVGKIY
jgi:hypothetical protein